MIRQETHHLQTPQHSAASATFSLAVCIACFGVLSRIYTFWDRFGFPLITSSRTWLLIATVFFIASLFFSKLNWRSLRLDPEFFVFGLLLLFFGDWLTRGYNLLQGPTIRGEILLGSILCYFIYRRFGTASIPPLVILALYTLVSTFYSSLDGRLLFSDDHPVFMYRLSLLQEHFPNIPVFDVLWNGGSDSTHIFATGAINVFLLLFPLFLSGAASEVYNVAVMALLFGIVPVSIFIAARLEKLPLWSAMLAGLLAVTSGLFWYRWALKYGTLGFITSTALVPLVLVLVVDALDRTVHYNRGRSWGFAVTASLMLCWTPTGLIFLPLILLACFRLPELLRQRGFLLGVLVTVVVTFSWTYMLFRDANLDRFISSEKPPVAAAEADSDSVRGIAYRHQADGIDLDEAKGILRETAVGANPVILMLLIPGIFCLRSPRRYRYLSVYVWLLILGTVLVPIKPQLEFDRMLIVLLIAGTIPTAAAIQAITERIPITGQRFSDFLPLAVVGGFIFAAVFATAGVLRNRSVEHYSLMNPSVQEFSNALRMLDTPGRILFSGFVLHELSGGHLAPLAIWTGKPMLASSHVHNIWSYKQIIPDEFYTRGEQGIEEYFTLYNVSAVVAHEPFWQQYFRDRSNIYKAVGTYGSFSLFRREQLLPGYFVSGKGELLKHSTNGAAIRLDTADAVLRFTYNKQLVVTDNANATVCNVEEEKISASVSFARLINCPVGVELWLKTPPLLKRLL